MRESRINSVKGSVFDIQRFSTRDGPGIRTTIFLKGCPLRCIWCHNPESLKSQPQLSFAKHKCVGCMKCVEVCKNGVHMNLRGKHAVIHEKCLTCGDCVNHCCYGAVEIIGRKMTVDEIMDDIVRDRNYYDMDIKEHGLSCRGGVTLSGGEPLMQPEFTIALLKALKEENIDTCIETCGYVKEEIFKKVIPYVDHFLYDCKASSADHKRLTGVENDLILKNLNTLMMSGCDVTLRCPMVQGINDTEEHFKEIAEIVKKYPSLSGVEIMAYHNMGNSKSENIGVETPMSRMKSADKDVIESWIKRFAQIGVDVRIG